MRGSYLHLISNTALHITFLSYCNVCRRLFAMSKQFGDWNTFLQSTLRVILPCFAGCVLVIFTSSLSGFHRRGLWGKRDLNEVIMIMLLRSGNSWNIRMLLNTCWSYNPPITKWMNITWANSEKVRVLLTRSRTYDDLVKITASSDSSGKLGKNCATDTPGCSERGVEPTTFR